MNFVGRAELIKRVQAALNLSVDGVDGEKTWNAIAAKVCPVTEPTPSIHTTTLSPKAMQLILDYEVGGGEGYYNKCLKHPTYPGGESGVTIGIGYDLGYNTLDQFKVDWGHLLNQTDFNRLAKHIGKKSSTAKAAIADVRDITILWDAALSVFESSTLPRFISATIKAFPGAQELNPDAFGALVSLVFNRGGSLTGSTRVEMANINKAVTHVIATTNIYVYIASQIRAMKHLWVGKGLDGLLKRRDEEANLVENCK